MMESNSSGIEQRFFAKPPIELPWLFRLFEQVKAETDGSNFDSVIFLTRGPVRRITLRSEENWRASLTAHWDNCSGTGVWIGDIPRCYVAVDRPRAMITVEIRDQTDTKVTQIIRRIADAFELEIVEDTPYRYRTSSARYKVRNWNRKQLVEGLAKLVQNVSLLDNSPVREAYVTERVDKVERLRGFHDVRSLLQHIGTSTAEFEKIGFVVDGAAGAGFGISFNLIDMTMEFRTSYAPEELGEVLSPLQTRLDLKLVEAGHSGSSLSGDPTSAVEPWWSKHFFAIIVAVIGGALGAAAVGLEVMRALFTDFDLHVTSPTAESTVFETAHSPIHVSWYLKPKDSLFNSIDRAAPADLAIMRDAQLIDTRPAQQPGARLELTPGRYVIEVRPTGRLAEPKSFTVVVK